MSQRLYRFDGTDYKLHYRDSQRQRCYDAETAADLCGHLLSGEEMSHVNEYVAKVAASCSWIFLSKQHRAKVVDHTKLEIADGRGARCAKGWAWGISIPRRSRRAVVVLHELAHVLAAGAAHHWPWANCFLRLVKEHLGAEAGNRLEEQFKLKGVRYQPPLTRRPMNPEALERLRARGHQLAAAAKARREQPKESQ